MKVYQTNEIKNIALLGSAGSGKTTLAESMLYEAGIIKRRGSVEAKNTVSDYFPVELEYGYSVFPTVFHVEWNNKKLNIIDCPGSDDFVGGAITSLNVTDQAVILINGQYGPEVGTQNNFRYTEKLKKPVIFLINQLDSYTYLCQCDIDNIAPDIMEEAKRRIRALRLRNHVHVHRRGLLRLRREVYLLQQAGPEDYGLAAGRGIHQL